MHLIKTIFIALACLPGVAGLLQSADEKEFEIIANPHDDRSCVPNLDSFLEPYFLLTKPLATQEDTFQELSYTKIMGVPIPTYRMKQPKRLSDAELQYQLVLVKDLSAYGKSQIKTASVEMERAKDSWFPGYYWNPLFMYCPQANELQHVGWKFMALDSKNPLPFFYALMAKIEERRKGGEAVHTIVGFRAPGWVASQLLPI
mmetsp:Transcript_125052/g.186781  ORF Transcript_125052/g.186781 Transcript_125052/m.186781 type:complete len:202 (-) Transcript_125052:184-789(-)|eukprot:CAMPEP_0117030922 /NCGR_PEP_ID=MMETSP0472-20121206/22279_1 /TAXON_ID=693140 ORGANISM="Tiarina fusus, Strain LIS" /NCGR_SAMPLE_ID=MMETSP0472 /ASSEMBLY_ACC=CAM_ASM_000603 /LENGTH=201 /DNA_ID=CAMNT_0004739129 /DNA_START=68 /DNA_END=673 /DNA_ORIENTATION=+